MKNKESYYAIIPANVRYCEELTTNAKLLYGEITALCNKEGYCWATNSHFAKLFNVNKTTISIWISSLQENGFIKCRIKSNNMRRIYLKHPSGKSKGGLWKNPKGVSGKSKGSYNNTTNTKRKNIDSLRSSTTLKKGLSKNKLVKHTPKDISYDLRCTTMLEKRIFLPPKKIGTPEGCKQFRLLHTTHGFTKKRIIKVLKWFIAHIKDKYTPSVFKAQDFREKFLRIENIMNRSQSETPEEIKISSAAKEIAKRLSHLSWEGSDDQLLGTIQISLNNYNEFYKWFLEISKTGDRHHIRLCEHLHGCYFLAHPKTFVKDWMEKINKRIIDWDEWSGNLIKMAFNRKSKLFQRLGRKEVEGYSGYSSGWDRLMVLIEKEKG